ncbi:MAG: hypothetical protein IK100_09540 [Muribaculaceae bacterium]|nr:hypothetical protein [Muribaculaceae bacterium]
MADVWGIPRRKAEKLKAETAKTEGARKGKSSHRRKTAVCEISDRTLCRRAWGVENLLRCIGMTPNKEGTSLHIMTGGNVDTLSMLKGLLLHIRKIKRIMISTWVISSEDVLQLDEWLGDGTIETLEVYVGEIYPSQYKVEWSMLRETMAKHNQPRLCYFANHAKVMAVEDSEGGKYVIESSANLNTNPRNENCIITKSDELCDFYFDYYKDIRSYNYEEV